MAEFHIQTKKLNNNVTFIAVQGFLDAHTFEEMEKTINDLFDGGTYRLVVDLSKLDYISSAGAGVFIGAIGTAQENEGNIVLMKPSPNVKEVFDLLGLSQIFPFANDVEGAQKLFS
ncbi:MAG: STAS domain-containing protein [Planctomycetia bacterium]|nr:STAS domain-containing protein [Planctomycetia bacterium]